MRSNRILSIGAVSAFLVAAMMPLPADAAWWKLGRDSKAPAVAEDSLVLAQVSPHADERFNRVEAQMRNLTGHVEELTFQISQLQAQIRRMQEDNEFRFRELEGGTAPTSRSEAPVETPSTDLATASPPAPPTLLPPDTTGQSASLGTPTSQGQPLSGPGAPPQPLGTLTLSGAAMGNSGQPLDLTAPLPPVTAPAGPDLAMAAPTGDARSDFERAYRLVLSGDYATAEVALRQFLETYPEDARAPDARYWLGESLFSRAQFREAAVEFHATYKSYPTSSRAPDALLKLGLSLAGFGERDTACATFASVLKQFPDVSNTLRQRVSFEQASAGC
jgi:tol-pal system protein YbgF